MTQSAPTLALLTQGAPIASKCGDATSYSIVKIANPYDCFPPEAYQISNVAAIAPNDSTAMLFVSGTPAGAPIPDGLAGSEPYVLYANTVLSFPGATAGTFVEIVVLANVKLSTVAAGVAVPIAKAPAAVAAAKVADLYRAHTLIATQNVDITANDSSEDTTKINVASQETMDVTVRGRKSNITSFLNISDEAMFRCLQPLLNNSGDKGLISIYGLPGMLDVGMASFVNGTITRQAKQKAKLTAEVDFSAPFVRYLPLQYEPAARQALLTEQARLWGYSVQSF